MGLLKRVFERVKSFFCSDIDGLDSVFYIGMGENLKSPLSSQEEFDTLTALENGDESAKNILIEHNLRLVVFISKKFLTTGHSLDDLISIGSIGLIKAVNSFKLDKNIKLATYASRCIENEILMFLRKTVRQKNEVSLEEPIKKDSEGGELSLADVIAGGEGEALLEKIEETLAHEVLISCVKKLTQREQEIMTMRFGLAGIGEQTQKDVADRLDISQSYISRLEKKIISKLKKEMEKLA